MKKVKYETGYGTRYTEENIYSDGCVPNSGSVDTIRQTFKGNTLKELLKFILEYHDVDINQVELDACEEQGRIDISVLETDRGYKAMPEVIESWKLGYTRLWSAIYTYTIKKVTREDVSLIEPKEDTDFMQKIREAGF